MSRGHRDRGVSGGKRGFAIELQDSGNLDLHGDDGGVVWQSFSHPTDTLLWNQEFSEGMKLVSNPSSNNLSYILQIKYGDLVLSSGYQTPQPYWSMAKEILFRIEGQVVLQEQKYQAIRAAHQNLVILTWNVLVTSASALHVSASVLNCKAGVVSSCDPSRGLQSFYKDLQTATNNFSVKLGQRGFASVYQGILPDGTRLAVKKLEGIGQGQKEFQAEVTIIGSIHHLHLVWLRGFCANGSLDKWIFMKYNKESLLDWEDKVQYSNVYS
nr:G-type lectin S-receptor-like serine/threonine-protein kinase SD2-5 [Malus domestica]